MEGTPGIIPKAALTTSRVVYKPFTIPLKLNESATLVGAAGNSTVAAINGSIGTAVMGLKPRVGAEAMAKFFTKIDAATKRSDAIAKRNKDVFWDPFSNGVESVGRAIAGPGAAYYLNRAGIEPTADNIKGVLNLGLFDYPVGGGSQGGDAGAGDAGAQQAAAAAAQQAAAQQAAAQQAAAQQAAQQAAPAQ